MGGETSFSRPGPTQLGETSGKQLSREPSQKTTLPQLTTTLGDHWGEMGSWEGKTALPGNLPVGFLSPR